MEQLKNNVIVLKEKPDIMKNRLDDVYKNFEKNYKLPLNQSLFLKKYLRKAIGLLIQKKNNTA